MTNTASVDELWSCTLDQHKSLEARSEHQVFLKTQKSQRRINYTNRIIWLPSPKLCRKRDVPLSLFNVSSSISHPNAKYFSQETL